MKKRRPRRRQKQGQSPTSPPQEPVSREGMRRVSQPIMAGASADSMPDVVLMRVVEIIGTPYPPRCAMERTELPSEGTVKDLMAMSRVCRRWKEVVRSSGVWKPVCEWRWPCLCSEGGQGMDREMYWDPRYRLTGSPWMDIWMRTGRCHSSISRYMMLVSVTVLRSGVSARRLLSQAGVLTAKPIGQDLLSAKCLVGEGVWGGIRAWPLEEVLSPTTGEHDLMGALCDKVLIVRVHLVDRDTGKVASWYEAVMQFDKEDPHDPDSALIARQPLKVSLPNIHTHYEHKPRLIKNTAGPRHTTIGFELQVKAPDILAMVNLAGLPRALDWS